jgi:hypothetical protein
MRLARYFLMLSVLSALAALFQWDRETAPDRARKAGL